MTRTDADHDPDTTEFSRGYNAAKNDMADFRHDRWWIDDERAAELARPEVVKGIEAFYRDAAAASLAQHNERDAAQIEEWNEAFERAAIERHDDIH